LTLANRVCSCGAFHDRDVNAAKNILAQSLRDAAAIEEKLKAVGTTVLACGEESAGRGRKTAVKLASLKQECTHNRAIAA